MGLFDKFMKKQEKQSDDLPEKELTASGWDAITAAFEKLYPTQKNPKHYGTLISWELGGNNPLRGISIYDGGDYWHFVIYGLSELYEKESDNQGIDTKMQSNITGFITVPEKAVESIMTPNGKVNFVEFIGATDSELKAIQDKKITVKELYERLGTDVTSYARAAVL